MVIPDWLSDIDGSFRATSAPVVAYTTFIKWSYENLPPNEHSMIEHPEGNGSCWPLNTTPPNVIHEALATVLRSLPLTRGINVDDRPIRYIYRRLLQQVHEDRYQQHGFRTFYASRACTAMFTRCTEVVEGEGTSTDTYPMPLMVITPFVAREARLSPPSFFEYYAADVSRTRSNLDEDDGIGRFWTRIHTAGRDESVIRSQGDFMSDIVDYDLIYFGQFSRLGGSCDFVCDGTYNPSDGIDGPDGRLTEPI